MSVAADFDTDLVLFLLGIFELLGLELVHAFVAGVAQGRRVLGTQHVLCFRHCRVQV